MDTTIAILPGPNPERRVRVSLVAGQGTAGLHLVDESFSPDVGWYAQSSLGLTPDQIAALRPLLGQQSTAKAQATLASASFQQAKARFSVVRAS